LWRRATDDEVTKVWIYERNTARTPLGEAEEGCQLREKTRPVDSLGFTGWRGDTEDSAGSHERAWRGNRCLHHGVLRYATHQ
jgi:hypothetical protein